MWNILGSNYFSVSFPIVLVLLWERRWHNSSCVYCLYVCAGVYCQCVYVVVTFTLCKILSSILFLWEFSYFF